jgi:sugar-specific transcriptional regulator TrmB
MSLLTQEYDGVHRALVLFGLTDREARIYLQLVTHEDATAGELAKKLGLHRLDVYYDLKSLQQKEMVDATLSRPMVYKAHSIDRTIKIIEEANRDQLRKISDAMILLRAARERLSHVPATAQGNGERRRNHVQTDTIRIISGRKAIRAKWLDLLKGAKKEVLITATEKGPAQSIFLSAVDVISRKMRGGVNVRVFTTVKGTRDQRIRRIQSKVRHLAASAPAGLCVIDRNTALIITGSTGTGRSASSQETALLTNSKSIGEMLRTLFFVGWNTSPTFEERTR